MNKPSNKQHSVGESLSLSVLTTPKFIRYSVEVVLDIRVKKGHTQTLLVKDQ